LSSKGIVIFNHIETCAPWVHASNWGIRVLIGDDLYQKAMQVAVNLVSADSRLQPKNVAAHVEDFLRKNALQASNPLPDLIPQDFFRAIYDNAILVRDEGVTPENQLSALLDKLKTGKRHH